MILKVLNLKNMAFALLLCILGFSSNYVQAQCSAGAMPSQFSFACAGASLSTQTFGVSLPTSSHQLYYVLHSGSSALGTTYDVNTTGVFTNNGVAPQGADLFISSFVATSPDPTLACDIALPGQLIRFYEPVSINVTQNTCNDVTGVLNVTFNVSGGSPDFPDLNNFVYTLSGDVNQSMVPGQSVSYTATNATNINLVVLTDGKGCDASLTLPVNCVPCDNQTGGVQPLQYICNEDVSFSALATLPYADPGSQIFYVVHESPTSLFPTIAMNHTGVFASALLTQNTQYYVSSVVGVPGTNGGLPNTSDPCTVVMLPGSPVVLLNPIEITVSDANDGCDSITGITTFNFTVEGGLNDFNGTFYNATGNYTGMVLANQTYSFAESGSGTAVINIMDGAGCTASEGRFYNCNGCNNFAGTAPSDLQYICANTTTVANGIVTGALVDLDAQLVYVLHDGFNILGNDIIDVNTTGIFPYITGYPINSPLYISAMVGVINAGDSIPNILSACTSIALPGTPVFYVAEIEVQATVTCDEVTGNATVCIVASGGDNGSFSVNGTLQGTIAQNVSLCSTYNEFDQFFETYAVTLVNTGTGCVSGTNGSYTCEGCENYAGQPNLPVVLCAGEVADGNIPMYDVDLFATPIDSVPQPFADPNAICIYVLHDGENSVGNIYGIDTSGLFPWNASIPTDTQLYITIICGRAFDLNGLSVLDANGLPSLNDPCTDVMLPGSPVVYLAPIEFDNNLACDLVSGVTTISYTVTGGLPSYNGTFYEISGTNPEIVANMAINSFTVNSGAGTIVLTAIDDNGCEAANTFPYDCTGCNNFAGNPVPAQTACWGQSVNAQTTGSLIDPGSNMVYILHDCTVAGNGAPIGGIISFNSSGTFTNNNTNLTNIDLCITTAVGTILPGGLPDATDPCTNYSNPVQVSFFQQIIIDDSWICDDVSGVITVTATVNGGAPQFNFPASTLIYTITGGFANPGQTSSPGIPFTFQIGQNAASSYQIIASDIAGCSNAVVQPFSCIGCMNNAGVSPAAQSICANESANGAVSGGNVDSGDNRVYILHDGTSTFLGTPISSNITGVFQNTGNNTNEQLYITPVVGPLLVDGTPDYSDPCTVIGFPGTPVVFLDPISVTPTFTCDQVAGFGTVTYLIAGGLPQYNSATAYNVNENGSPATISFGAGGNFILPVAANGSFLINVTDANGCTFNYSENYNCLQCQNDAGVSGPAQIICAGESLICTSTTAIADPGSEIRYVIHDGTTTVGNNLLVTEAISSTGILTNNGQFPTGVQLYCSVAVGVIGVNDLPDLTDPCSDINLPGTPVMFSSPVIIDETVNCNIVSGETTVTLVVTGGLETTYDVLCSAGTFNDPTLDFNVPTDFIIPVSGQNTITCVATDPNGCVGTQTFDYDCDGCANEAGTMGQVTQYICQDSCAIAISTGFAVDTTDNPLTDLVYVLHTGVTNIGDIVAYSPIGQFCNDGTLVIDTGETTYYISAIVAEIVNGEPNFGDPCLQVSLPGTPVIFPYPIEYDLNGECDIISGVFDSELTITSGSVGFFTIAGDYNGIGILGIPITVPDDGDGIVNILIEDAAGCTFSEQIPYNCDFCPNVNPGLMPATPIYACNNETFTVGPSFASFVGIGAELCYFIHHNENDVANTTIATSCNGVFTNVDLDYWQNVPLYVTAVVGPLPFGQNEPDPNDPCTEISNATPLGLLAEMVITEDWDCDAQIGEFNVNFEVSGGLPSFPGSGALYNYSGDEVGITAADTQVPIGPYGDGSIYNISVVDGEGCMASFTSLPIQCEKLPIELIDFTGTIEKEGNLLKWQTATEFNNDYFTLLRSSNNGEFEAIATINSKAVDGNSISTLAYTYLDNTASNGSNLYKLVQSDLDGRSNQINKFVELSRENNAFVVRDLFPNPIIDVLNVTVETNIKENLSIVIYDYLGRSIITKEIEAENNVSTIVIDTEILTSGSYILSINSGDTTETKRFVKN